MPRRITIWTLILVTLLLPYTVSGYELCFQQAGERYGIPPELLKAISIQESGGNPAAYRKNTNGTYDAGMMQVNSCHARSLGGDTWSNIYDPCTNIHAGAWILSNCIRDYGYSWKAVGCYHSRTPWRRDNYAMAVYGILTGKTSRHLKYKNRVGTSPAAAAQPADESGIMTVSADEKKELAVYFR